MNNYNNELLKKLELSEARAARAEAKRRLAQSAARAEAARAAYAESLKASA